MTTERIDAPPGSRLRGRGRAVELLETLVTDVVEGGSRVLLVRGDAGIGKTALLDDVAARASGLQTLRVTGVPSEQHLPLAGLLAVARPLAGHVTALPPVQASSLGAALGRTSGGAGDPYSLYAGTLGLLAAAAEDAPLLVLVDDLHWLDASSGAALLFAARRLDREGVGMIFVVRDGEDVELDLRGMPEPQLTGLDDDAAREVVADRAGTVLADETLAQLVRSARGNPLALAELTDQLDGPQLAGRAPLPEPLVLGPRLGELYRQRLGALPDHTRRALLVAAVCDTGHLGTVVRACGHEGLDPGCLDPAETAGLVTISGERLAFRHPLVRAAVLGGATDSRRRDAHLVLAEVCADDPARHAWHRSWAVPGPDEEVAAALERAAGFAAARGGLTESATLLERAAGLSASAEAGGRRLTAAARQRLADQAEALMRTVVAAARARSAITLLPIPLAVLAYVELRTGATAVAHSDASDAVRLARDVGGGTQYSSAESVLAGVEAVRGRDGECRAAADRAIGAERGTGTINTRLVAHAALGFSALGAARPDLALAPLLEARRLNVLFGVPDLHWMPWQPDLVDGATNREAAAALFLSPKTVENHLGRVYAKLGVRSRTELGARLRATPAR